MRSDRTTSLVLLFFGSEQLCFKAFLILFALFLLFGHVALQRIDALTEVRGRPFCGQLRLQHFDLVLQPLLCSHVLGFRPFDCRLRLMRQLLLREAKLRLIVVALQFGAKLVQGRVVLVPLLAKRGVRLPMHLLHGGLQPRLHV